MTAATFSSTQCVSGTALGTLYALLCFGTPDQLEVLCPAQASPAVP